MQGDVLLAEKLTQLMTRPDGRCALVATFIHRVVPALETISSLRSRRSNKAAWLAAWRDQNIFFNRTHVGMAVQVVPPPRPFVTTHCSGSLVIRSCHTRF